MTLRILDNVDEEVLCTVSEIQAGQAIFFLGTNKGNIYKYNLYTGVRTLLTTLTHMITSIDIYSATLYIGMDNGDFCQLPT